uniref:Fcf2 pre-rRNA processing protein n=1 Tax=Toxoplasma gondii COUG TaxID=1074873 RepID=A0A2G8XRA3_TOXGO|nr:Fcf2 pre-rRNA processing protein [Toxoplasma gondii COUG]
MKSAIPKGSQGKGGKKGDEASRKCGVHKQLCKERLRAIEAAARLLPPPPDDDACKTSDPAVSTSSPVPSVCSPCSSSSSAAGCRSASASVFRLASSADPALTSLSVLECVSHARSSSDEPLSSLALPSVSQTSLDHLDPGVDTRELCFSSQRVLKKRRERPSASRPSGKFEEASAVAEDAQGAAEHSGGMHELPRLDLTAAPGRFAFHRIDLDARAAASVTLDAKHHRGKKKLLGTVSGVHKPQGTLLVGPSPARQSLPGGAADAGSDRPPTEAAALLLPPTVKRSADLATLVDAGKLQQQERLAKRDAAKAHLANWYDIPAQELSPALRRELKVLELRGHMDPKKFHKEGLKIRSERTERRIGSGVYVQHTAHLHVCTVKDGFGSRGGVGAGRESEAVGCSKRRKAKGGSLLSSLLKDASVETWTRKKVRDLGSATFHAKGRKNSWKMLKKRR